MMMDSEMFSVMGVIILTAKLRVLVPFKLLFFYNILSLLLFLLLVRLRASVFWRKCLITCFVIPFLKYLLEDHVHVSSCRDLYAFSVIRYRVIWFWKEISSFFYDHHLLTSSCLVCHFLILPSFPSFVLDLSCLKLR